MKFFTLAIAAFTLAICGAIAASFAPVQAFVRVNTAATPCKLVATCDNAGSQNCTVSVFDTRINQIVTKQGYQNSGCTIPLTNTSSAPVTATATIP
jgi:acyl-CoA synthetase (AMP-forming)/AMP-acid ligase II